MTTPWTWPCAAVVLSALWVLVGLVGVVGFVVCRGWIADRRGERRAATVARRLLLIGAPAMLLFAAREFELRVWVDTTDGLGRMLITKRWQERHVTPQLNADGFRARAFPAPVRAASTPVPGRILVLGDSYAFGRGIDDPDQRLGGRLEARLQEQRTDHPGLGDPRVWTLARGGWGTQAELSAWRRWGPRIRPAVVVIAHCTNDIEDHIRHRSPLRNPPGGPIAWLVGRSFALNDLYWSLELHTNRDLVTMARSIGSAYGAGPASQAHRRDLLELIASIRSQEAEPILLLIPDPLRLPPTASAARARPASARSRMLADLAREAGVALVDPTPTFQRFGREAIVLNPNDYHTNELGHDLLAEALVPEVLSRLTAGH